MNWDYIQPVKISFGTGKIEDLFDILSDLNLKNGILVSDPIFKENGLAYKVLDYSKGLITTIFSNITPNPTVDSVDECADIIRKNNINFVVALGGGSSLDCAKAAASSAKTPYSIVEFHSGGRKLGNEHLPLIAIPTTSGTGSEVTMVAVLSDPKKGIKAPIGSPNFYPAMAIIDPALTVTVPKKVTAGTGLDVLSHALEGFWSKNHQPICDACAFHAIGLVFKYLLRAYNDGTDIEAREKMCEASLMAGLAFGLPKTTGSHACSFPLTSKYHIPHGEACAFTLDAFLRINKNAEGGRVNDLCKKLGFKDAEEMADKILAMKKEMGLKSTLEEAGINENDIVELAKLSQHPNMLNNPVDMSLDDIVDLYKSLK
ncbi:MAG: iron-containing alcohol dehydrogenase family protein [Clostridiaceae bacterium]